MTYQQTIEAILGDAIWDDDMTKHTQKLDDAVAAIVTATKGIVPVEKAQPESGFRYNDDALEGFNTARDEMLQAIEAKL